MNQFLLFCFTLILSATTAAQEKDPGQSLFIIRCSRCHGVKGGGGEGPALNRPHLPRAATDKEFSRIIMDGIPGTSMPGSWTLDEKQRKQIIGFVRSLVKQNEEIIEGNIENGAKLFEKSGCLSCHILNGRGSSLGPELTGVGLRRGTSHFKQSLIQPGTIQILDEKGFKQYLVIEVVQSDGSIIRGIRKNEDTFSIQLKDAENKFHSFRKDELKEIRRFEDQSLMPSFKSLSEKDRNDIIAYLANQKR